MNEAASATSARDKAVQSATRKLTQLGQTMASGPLKTTVVNEVLLAVTDGKFPTWGRHYVRTLPNMLRSERRSNFRDVCLQEYGKDAMGREALFEALSNEAETCFATLKPPTPSNVRSNAPRQTYTSMP